MDTKTCTKCKISQPISNFDKAVTYKGGRRTWCKSCCKACARRNYIKLFTYDGAFDTRFNLWKKAAKIRNLPFELTLKGLESRPRICHYTHQNLTLLPNQPTTISLDRLDSSKGYTSDNVVFCCSFVNYMKNDLTYDQFIYSCHLIAQVCPLPVKV
jgi:hypothetical protein